VAESGVMLKVSDSSMLTNLLTDFNLNQQILFQITFKRIYEKGGSLNSKLQILQTTLDARQSE